MRIVKSTGYRKTAKKKQDKFERCVRKVKKDQGCDGDSCEYNPYAVCHKSVDG